MADTAIETEESTDTNGDPGGTAGAVWEDAPAAGGIMAGVFASFSERGFDLGYRRAVGDMIALLLMTAAEHRRESVPDPHLRAAVSDFVDRLDRHLQRLSPATLDEVYGGLGI